MNEFSDKTQQTCTDAGTLDIKDAYFGDLSVVMLREKVKNEVEGMYKVIQEARGSIKEYNAWVWGKYMEFWHSNPLLAVCIFS